MIKPICDICHRELEDFGGLLLSPPEENKVKKNHICKKCYNKLKEEYNLK